MTEPGLSVRWVGSVAVAAVPAEVDLTNAQEILESLLSVVDDRPSMLVVDMTLTEFCDSAGAAALMQVQRTSAFAQVPLQLAASEPVARILSLLGLDRLIDVQPALATGLDGPATPFPERPSPPGSGSPG
jgi:anti-sigma B factor antagonist